MSYIVGIIQLLHLAIIFGVVVSVFVSSCYLKNLALTFLVFLLVQYSLGYGKCGLTELEHWFLGETEYKQGFMYRLINPLINVPENYFNNGLIYCHLVWICILIYQIYSKKCLFSLL